MRPRELIAQVASYYPSPYDVQAVIKRLGIEKYRRPSLRQAVRRPETPGAVRAWRLSAGPNCCSSTSRRWASTCRRAKRLWQVLRDLLHEGCSIVLTTHYIEEAEALADRVAVITRGRLVASGTVEEMRAHVSRKSIVCRTTPAARDAAGLARGAAGRRGLRSPADRDARRGSRAAQAARRGRRTFRHRGETCRSRRGVRRDDHTANKPETLQ